jgi:SAM-dependent methyltransferase/N-acetylglutamate synthase-like GNAT family acetyltransferase
MGPDFTNTYEDVQRASAYAQLDFPGTYHLAFRDLPALIQKHVHGTRALDFGCGTGRSTRFLKRLGFAAVGVDIASAMLQQARSIDPTGDYRLVTDDGIATLAGPFDLIFAAFTFDNIPTDAAKAYALRALRGLLASAGRMIVVVSSPEIYQHEWVSFSTKAFPENRRARDGDRVRIVMLDVPDRQPVEDVVCSDERYRALFAEAGLGVVEMLRPLGASGEGIAWVNEMRLAPWSIYVLGANEMSPIRFTHRLATVVDLDVLRDLMDASISELQKPFLDPRQIESSRMIMGLDTQLIEDGTYFIVEAEGQVAGCGGWSRRATLYGGNQTPGRNAEYLDPKRDPARVRAMYTHPAHARRGIGRLILSLCESAARNEGFSRVELMATKSGEPLYLACGYEPVEEVLDSRGGAAVPLVRMRKELI